MATITPHKRKNGTQYTARIRIRRDGRIVHDESETFSKRPLAQAWAKKREAALAEPGALERLMLGVVTVGQVLEWYKADYHTIKGFGRTKLNSIDQLIAYTSLAELNALTLTSGQLVQHVRRRRAEGTGPSTVNNDLVWLRVAMRAARIGRDLPVPLSAVDDAAFVCRSEGLIAKSKGRERRPTVAEITVIIDYFSTRDARAQIPMAPVTLFAMFSSRRQEEICRMRWADLDADRKRVLVREMKHPRVKQDTWVDVPERAWQILQAQPRTGECIFPYNSKSVSSAFTRSCQFLGIEGLRFHDLRHEAVSCFFEQGLDIPHASKVSGHRSWSSLQRYAQIEERGDKWAAFVATLPHALGGPLL
ncbi:site-specific integrase [Teredinibacter turnerae]|uniref:tyrosine-type recombinase/integrase n=1 Tax=Teredinibacter turnerae TaxID=2426 RepID=UPI0030CED1F7